MLILDCGACKGDFFSQYLGKGHKIYAFEPNKVNYDYLVSNYGERRDLTIIDVALGKEPKLRARLYRNRQDEPAGYQGSSILSDKENVSDNIYEEVHMTKLSNFIEVFLDDRDGPTPTIDILKMDIEGAEYDVLEDLIENDMINRIKKLIIEWHGDKGIPSIQERHKNFLPVFQKVYKGEYVKWH